MEKKEKKKWLKPKIKEVRIKEQVSLQMCCKEAPPWCAPPEGIWFMT